VVASSRSRSFSAWPSSSAPWRYGLAAAALGIAVLVMLALRSWGVDGDAAPVLLAAVAVGFLYGGPGPGLLALLVSGILIRDPIILGAGAALGAVCEIFRRAVLRQTRSRPAPDREETVPDLRGSALDPAKSQRDRGAATPPLKEVTTEATWRFHHARPLDITLPEEEQIEHLYLYSVLAECNDAFARMYGFRAAGDVVGTRLVVFLPPSNSDNVDYLRSFIRSGYRLEDANSQEIDRYGHTKYFVNNLVGIFERGQLIGAWGTQRDVTDQRRGITQEYRSRLHSTKSSSQ
jgi:PAS domain